MDTKTKTSPETTSKKKKTTDFSQYGKTVRISTKVYEYIVANGNFGETFDDVLKRLLQLN
jgi:hypothetical protein